MKAASFPGPAALRGAAVKSHPLNGVGIGDRGRRVVPLSSDFVSSWQRVTSSRGLAAPMKASVTAAVLLIVLLTSVWVGFDARSRDWRGNSFADRPWKWVIGSLLLWIVVFPLYLVKRTEAALATAAPPPRRPPTLTPSAVPGWTAEQLAATARPQPRSRSFRLEGSGNVPVWAWIALAAVVLVFLWTRGVFDQWLYHFHLNYNECGRNGFGATFCGDELKQYQQRLRDAGLSP